MASTQFDFTDIRAIFRKVVGLLCSFNYAAKDGVRVGFEDLACQQKCNQDAFPGAVTVLLR